jgi:maltooligosyltrehalose trehalohydrolase
MWSDDFHHAVHTVLTGERRAFLADFGEPRHLARALAEGFSYQGEVSPFRGGPRGTDTRGLVPAQFVVALQNHDQVGNRAWGERLAQLVPFDALFPAAALLVLGGPLPLLFMGEEYGEDRPFLYFTSHGDPALGKAVTEGRRAEHHTAEGEDVPDPQAPETFRRCVLTHRRDGRHGELRAHYRSLLAVRARHAAALAGAWPEVTVEGRCFTLRRQGLTVKANLAPEPAGGLPAWGWAVETAR